MKLYDAVKQYAEFEKKNVSISTKSDYKEIKDKYYNSILLELNKCSSKLDLEQTIKDYIYVLYFEDGIELYKKYFYLGNKNLTIIQSLINYLYFWGLDYDKDMKTIKLKISNNDLDGAINFIKQLKYE